MTVSQPNVIDFVVHDRKRDQALLVMVEDREWGHGGQLLPELQTKLNTYIAFIDDRLTVDYPELAGKAVHVELRSVFRPGEEELKFLRIVQKRHLQPKGIELSWRMIGESAEHGV
jgi:hypothetical protein